MTHHTPTRKQHILARYEIHLNAILFIITPAISAPYVLYIMLYKMALLYHIHISQPQGFGFDTVSNINVFVLVMNALDDRSMINV